MQAIQYMAEQIEVPLKLVAAFFNLLMETAPDQTRKSGKSTVPGLGKPIKAQRSARSGRNPQTGEAIKIMARTAVKFRLKARFVFRQ